MYQLLLLISVLFISLFSFAAKAQQKTSWDTLQVTATAYNSLEEQTKSGNPAITAWGDKLKPGMNAIAVSRDLIALGLTHNTRVRIEGMDGIYYVKDKMHKRWQMKIDIYMGTNREKALLWGKRNVIIYVERSTDN